MKKTKKAREALHKFNMPKIKKLLDERSPDIVFCTQAFPCGMVADYKRSCGKNVILAGILTDYAPHSYWLFDEVDFYCVPSEGVARVLMDKGVSQEKIKVYGIPVDPKFQLKHDPRRVRKNLNLREEDPVVLVMGGTQGLGAIEEVVRSFLEDTERRYQLLIVAGSNKKLYSKLKKIKRNKGGEDIHVFSYIENIDELMEVSDVIITKAGGMTIAEALVKNLPMLIVDPIPGHERMNTDYLKESGAAVEAEDYRHIHQSINELFGSKDMLINMKSNIEKIFLPDSALNIAKLMYTK